MISYWAKGYSLTELKTELETEDFPEVKAGLTADYYFVVGKSGLGLSEVYFENYCPWILKGSKFSSFWLIALFLVGLPYDYAKFFSDSSLDFEAFIPF